MADMAVGDCGACIGGDCDGEYCTVSESKTVKARKLHTCDECEQAISVGEMYERISQLYDGEWTHMDICATCSEISICLSCDGRILGNMWEDIKDNVFPNMTTGCLAKLKTAAAKQRLVDEWRKWKF
jgi:hypothetical protein